MAKANQHPAEPHHIQNPIEWISVFFQHTWSGLGGAARALHGSDARAQFARPLAVNRITTGDLKEAVKCGFEDLGACRTDVLFIGLIYPLVGILITSLAFNEQFLPLIFPLVSGFALLGPLAAIGLYDLSRQREAGQQPSWVHAFSFVRTPAYAAIIALGLISLALFLLWLGAAYLIYALTLGPEAPASLHAFVNDVLTTPQGCWLMGVGVGVGFLFAVVVLAITVVSFPLLLDREVGVYTAIATSIRVVRTNPYQMALWGLLVAVSLVIASIPALLGLIIVMPVLGHATWHLYRKLVPRQGSGPVTA